MVAGGMNRMQWLQMSRSGASKGGKEMVEAVVVAVMFLVEGSKQPAWQLPDRRGSELLLAQRHRRCRTPAFLHSRQVRSTQTSQHAAFDEHHYNHHHRQAEEGCSAFKTTC